MTGFRITSLSRFCRFVFNFGMDKALPRTDLSHLHSRLLYIKLFGALIRCSSNGFSLFFWRQVAGRRFLLLAVLLLHMCFFLVYTQSNQEKPQGSGYTRLPT